MNIKLERPIVFFDLETTGVSIVNDRIVQIGAIKIFPNGDKEIKNRLVNPTIPIPKESAEVHGISDEDVKDQPVFAQIAKAMFDWLKDSDLAGYNSDNFDIPLLAEEFLRVGIEYPTKDVRFIDVIKIERLVNSHRLGDTYERYTGEILENAHDALADIEATIAIFEHQVKQNEALQIPIEEIENLCQGDPDIKKVDFAGKLYEENGGIYWNFGKHRGELVKETADYAKWVLGGEFASDTKKHIKIALQS